MSDPQYRMEISLNVLEHLGINLYSNVPSVLSEIVANSWDADASELIVRFLPEESTIIIQDNGVGMTHAQVNERFLLIGYRRRDKQPGMTTKGRDPMGRKGIGKLSIFSIANEITVETVCGQKRSALCMKREDIREAIKQNKKYYLPKPLSTNDIDFEKGTRITLKGLKKRQTVSTVKALRTRLARRFSVIGPNYDFEVIVNDCEITPEDRGYYDKIQYIWTYGDTSSASPHCKKLENSEPRPSNIAEPSMTVSGWLGTVKESRQLKDSYGENLNRIAIFVRGKTAQEDILADFSERGIYASYLIGELRIDELDTDHEEDAATSSRQKIVEDDPRYLALKEFLINELKHIQNKWSELRLEAGVKSAREIPAVKKWIDDLPPQYSRKAKKWLGRINRINVDKIDERRQLTKHAILAFEFYKWNENIDRLKEITDENLDTVIRMFQELDGLEANLYGQIVQQRMAVIRTLQEKIDQKARERAIQKYIFDHLWLLDPSWERVEASERMETRVGKLFEKVDSGLSEEEQKGRIDIQYRKTAGQHVIIELKKPDRSVSVYDLAKQIEKYRNGMRKILNDMNTPLEPVEFVCLLGKPPTEYYNEGGKQTIKDILQAQDARYVHYDELLKNAFEAYRDYTEKGKVIDRLSEVIKAIDDYDDESR